MNYTIEKPLEFIAERDWNPELVAASTSKLCRFTGRCKYFYSVAQHMQLAAHIAGRLMHRKFAKQKQVEEESSWYAGGNKRAVQFFRVMLMAHLHDSIEHLTGDIITPVKRTLMFNPDTNKTPYKDLFQWENAKLQDIYKYHGIDPTLLELEAVTLADRFALSFEVKELMDWEHPCWQSHLETFPVSTFPNISIEFMSSSLAEQAWLEDYYDLCNKLTSREALLV